MIQIDECKLAADLSREDAIRLFDAMVNEFGLVTFLDECDSEDIIEYVKKQGLLDE